MTYVQSIKEPKHNTKAKPEHADLREDLLTNLKLATFSKLFSCCYLFPVPK